jgi:hypothetical protein
VKKRAAAGHRPRVLAACFAGLYETRFLGPALDGIADLDELSSRVRVLAQVSSKRPSLLLLPAVDAHGVATSALVEHCVGHAPGIPVLVIITGHRSTGRAIARAMESGGHVVSVTSAEELRTAVTELLAGQRLTDEESARLDHLLKGLDPRPLGELLRRAVVLAHEGIGVDRLAQLAGSSRRSVTRGLRTAGWPAPGELIGWSRLFRAALSHPGTASGVAADARAAGFGGAQSLARACERLLKRRGPAHKTLSAARVGIAFRERLNRGSR